MLYLHCIWTERPLLECRVSNRHMYFLLFPNDFLFLCGTPSILSTLAYGVNDMSIIPQYTVGCWYRKSHAHLLVLYYLCYTIQTKTFKLQSLIEFNAIKARFSHKINMLFRSDWVTETMKCHRTYLRICRMNSLWIEKVHRCHGDARQHREGVDPARPVAPLRRPNYTTPDLRTTSFVFTSRAVLMPRACDRGLATGCRWCSACVDLRQ